jgi:hypothetical protein
MATGGSAMTGEEAAVCLAQLREGFPGSAYTSGTLGAWLEPLRAVDARDFAVAVTQAITEDAFPPSLARLLDAAQYAAKQRERDTRRALPPAPVVAESPEEHVRLELARTRLYCTVPRGSETWRGILDECERLVPAEKSAYRSQFAESTMLGIGEAG